MTTVTLVCCGCGGEHEIEVSVHGEHREATWGYHGGSPPEYPELEYDFPQECGLVDETDPASEPCTYRFGVKDENDFRDKAWREVGEAQDDDPRGDEDWWDRSDPWEGY